MSILPPLSTPTMAVTAVNHNQGVLSIATGTNPLLWAGVKFQAPSRPVFESIVRMYLSEMGGNVQQLD